ncbi:Poly(A)-specific ribonuclease PARN [Raphanus sativus]|nr:Poly(A)-specific ribonuclease PARN [Raphanus sativus]
MRRHKRWPLRPLASALIRSRFCFSSATETVTTEAFPLKHVTRSNFETTLNELRAHVKAADFVAIDLEMTGVTSAPWRDSLEFDRYDVRYLKVKDSAEKFAVVQHNFFIFPRQELTFDHPPAHEFLCQTTSMDFLAKYQFDFNACIHEGISYLSRRQEEDASNRFEMLYSQQGVVEVEDFKLVRLADVLFAERMKNKLNEWRSELLHGGPNASSQSSSNGLTQSTETVFYHMRPALNLRGFTSHQLRVIQLVLKRHFGDLVYIHANDKSSSCSQDFVVYTDSESDKENLLKEAKDERKRVAERKIQSAIGFRHVIDLLSSEKKLIVGHNSILDIAHVYSKFVGPLPPTAEEFVASIRDHFPYIVDTKILVNVNPMLHQRMKKSSTSLSSAFSSLCPQIELPSRGSDSFLQQRVKIDVEVDNIRCSKWNAGGKHEAGYDAFMTGCIFAQACSHLGFDFNRPSVDFAHNEKLEKYINRLYLSWSRGDIIDLRESHSNAENWRVSKFKYEKIVLIWNFPRKLKAREIKECICKAFGSTSVTSVYHLDDTAVFVLFKNSELVSEFLKLKEQLESDDGPVRVIHPLSKILEGGNTGAADYEAYKEICSSHISKVLFSDQAETVGVKPKTRADPKGETSSETGRKEKMVAVTDKASDLIDSFLANTVKLEAARIN